MLRVTRLRCEYARDSRRGVDIRVCFNRGKNCASVSPRDLARKKILDEDETMMVMR